MVAGACRPADGYLTAQPTTPSWLAREQLKPYWVARVATCQKPHHDSAFQFTIGPVLVVGAVTPPTRNYFVVSYGFAACYIILIHEPILYFNFVACHQLGVAIT